MGYKDELKRLRGRGSGNSEGVPFWFVVLLLLAVGAGVTFALRPDWFQVLLSPFSGGTVSISQDSRSLPAEAESEQVQPSPTTRVEVQVVEEEPQTPVVTRRRRSTTSQVEVQREGEVEPEQVVERPTPSVTPVPTSPTPSPESSDSDMLPLPGAILESFQRRGVGVALFLNQGVIALYNSSGLYDQTRVRTSGLFSGVYSISRDYVAEGAIVLKSSTSPSLLVFYSGTQPILVSRTTSTQEGEGASESPDGSESQEAQLHQQPEVIYVSLSEAFYKELQGVFKNTSSLHVF